MYHYVRPIKNSVYPRVKGLEIDAFTQQINYFKKNFHVLTASEFIDGLINQKEIKENSVLLTFDDGLKDHFLHVSSILQKNELQGLFFLSSKTVLDKKILDVHKIHFILEKNEKTNELVKEIFYHIKQNRDDYNLAPPEEYFTRIAKPNRFDSANIIFIKRILQRDLPIELREKIVDELFKKYVSNDLESFREELYLNEEDVREMAENSMYFGSHGYSHEWYTKFNDVQQKNELEKSFDFCSHINSNEKRLIFCYPYGDYDQRVIENVKNSGFVAGLTTQVGEAEFESSSAYSVKRYDTNDFPQ